MKAMTCVVLICALVLSACSGQRDEDREPRVPEALVPSADPAADPVLERPPIDLGDVDSGIMILGMLAPESDFANVEVDYLETQRGRLSMSIITVKPPFPESFHVRFEMASTRDFIERPVVVRVHAYRAEEERLGEEHAYVMGRTASASGAEAAGVMTPRAFTVNALEGLESIPDTLLVYAEADAWLMATGTDEEVLDPRVATSDERVSLFSNPVRINFERGDDD